MKRDFRGLFMKEWRMMKGFLIGIYMITGILMILMYISNGQLQMRDVAGLQTFGWIIVPASLLFSLNMETNQMASFLHHPQSAHHILLVKWGYSLLIACVYLFIIDVILIVGTYVQGSAFSLVDICMYISFLNIFLLFGSFVLAAIVVLLWTLHQVFRTYIRGFSLVFIIGIVILGVNLYQSGIDTNLYKNMVEWGEIDIAWSNQYGLIEFGSFVKHIYFGGFVFYSIVIAICYLISVYLIDHKVEAS